MAEVIIVLRLQHISLNGVTAALAVELLNKEQDESSEEPFDNESHKSPETPKPREGKVDSWLCVCNLASRLERDTHFAISIAGIVSSEP